MKKITTLASAVALAATSLSASAWWGGPCTPYGMTQEQQQAMAQQQTKAMAQMRAAQRRMVEQMAAQQARMAERMQAQGADPMTMGFPGPMDPLGDMGPWGAANPWDDMSMPKPPSMPTMPEPFGMDMPKPPIPAYMKDRYTELEAYRSKAMEESKARYDAATKEMTERRKELEANRHIRSPRSARPFTPPYTRMSPTPEIPTFGAPQARVPAQVGGTTPAPEVTPAPVVTATTQAPGTQTTPAAPVAPAPTPKAAPVAPAEATTTPQQE